MPSDEAKRAIQPLDTTCVNAKDRSTARQFLRQIALVNVPERPAFIMIGVEKASEPGGRVPSDEAKRANQLLETTCVKTARHFRCKSRLVKRAQEPRFHHGRSGMPASREGGRPLKRQSAQSSLLMPPA